MTYFCSAYCSTCNNINKNSCTGNCPWWFSPNTISGTNGTCLPHTRYIVLQQSDSSAYYSNRSIYWSCGQYLNFPGIFSSGETLIAGYYDNLVVPHYAIRVRVFLLWMDNWSNGNYIWIYINTTAVTRTNYSSSTLIQNECNLTTA
jgi:hypothetical protein